MEYVNIFLSSKAGRSAVTVAFYELPIRLFTQHTAGQWPPTEAGILSFIADLKRRRLSETTVHNYFRALRMWLNWLEKRGFLADNPIELIAPPPRPKLLPRMPLEHHLLKFFAALDAGPDHWRTVRDRAIFSLAIETGLRVSELAKIKLNDIDHQRKEIYVFRGKTHSENIVTFNGRRAPAALATWLDQRYQMAVPPKIKQVFISRKHGKFRPFTTSGIRQACYRWCRQAEIPEFSPHDLRHSYAILAIRNHADLLDVRDQLGHKSLKTTARYTIVANAGRSERHAQSSPLDNLLKRITTATDS